MVNELELLSGMSHSTKLILLGARPYIFWLWCLCALSEILFNCINTILTVLEFMPRGLTVPFPLDKELHIFLCLLGFGGNYIMIYYSFNFHSWAPFIQTGWTSELSLCYVGLQR